MNLEKAINNIKKEKQVPYADSIITSRSNIRIDVLFKSIEVAKTFCTAWAILIRKKTNEDFVFFSEYLLPTGQKQPIVVSYKAHRANRANDFSSEGMQRPRELKRRKTFYEPWRNRFKNPKDD